MTHYCLGFMFNLARTQVCLIEKTHPEWQAGLLNGVGGKLNNNEDSGEAMIREFNEETGVYHDKWDYKITMRDHNHVWQVDVFIAFTDKIYNVKTIEQEKVFIIDLNEWQTYNHITNLSWLIPLCLDQNDGKENIDYIISNYLS
jgi:8-oxo-dGTP diphosphatase